MTEAKDKIGIFHSILKPLGLIVNEHIHAELRQIVAVIPEAVAITYMGSPCFK